MRVTPSPPLRTANRPIMVLRTAIFGIVWRVPFKNKNNHFWRFHFYKVYKIIVWCMHVNTNLNDSFCVCLLDFPVFDLLKSMFKRINAKLTPNMWNIYRYLTSYVTFVVIHDIFKVKLYVCVRHNRIFAYCVPPLCVSAYHLKHE